MFFGRCRLLRLSFSTFQRGFSSASNLLKPLRVSLRFGLDSLDIATESV